MKVAEYFGCVFYLWWQHGGEGKVYTFNHGLRTICVEGWYEVVLIIDVDVIFMTHLLRWMVGYFVDFGVGVVMVYIKEGSWLVNYMNWFVLFEYISAQVGVRCVQNVLGVQVCLVGGAQLLWCESLEVIGGEIDIFLLVEDMFMIFNVQLVGKCVVFELYVIVWVEELRDIVGLWK